MASIWSKASSEPPIPGKDESDVADTGLADVGLPSPSPHSNPLIAGRPQLSRNQPQPPPPHQPPPPPAPQQSGAAADSLSLMQLRRIVNEFPQVEPTAYAFNYTDTTSFEEEVDEWFSYHDAEFARLQRAKDTFHRRWKKVSEKSWIDTPAAQKRFIQREITGLHATDIRRRCKSLQTILHLLLGVWDETAGVTDIYDEGEKPKTTATRGQLDRINTGILLATECGGVSAIFEVLKRALDRLW